MSRKLSSNASTEKPHNTNWNQFISKKTSDTTESETETSSSPTRFTLAVKDNIATIGTTFPTTCASGMLRGYASPFEATIVTQLRKRGAVVVGKTNLDEFGMGSHNLYSKYGPVAASESQDGPSPDAVSVGGSSGGSATAVRLDDAQVALGTDTGGSVRLPAAYGGVIGFKPSYGMLSRFGVVPYANSLDTVGLLAKTVAPLRKLLFGDKLWAEADDKQDPTSHSSKTRLRIAAERWGYGDKADGETIDLRGLSFGIPLEYNIAELDPRIRDAWIAVADKLEQCGATVSGVALPSTKHALSTYYVLAPAEAASNLSRYDGVRYGGGDDKDAQPATPAESDGDDAVMYERVRGAGFGPEVQQRILLGNYVLSSAAMDNYFLQAQRVRRLVVRDFDAAFKLANPLRDHDVADKEGFGGQDGGAIDLSDLPEGVPLADKRGPARVDFLLCPTAPTPAPKLADMQSAPSPVDAYMNDVFTVPASLAGLPAVSVPVPPSDPTQKFCPGLQLIGQFWDDSRLLAVAEALTNTLFVREEDRETLKHHQKTGVAE